MRQRGLFAVAVPAMILHVSVATAFVHVTLHHPAPPFDVEALWWADVYNFSTETVAGRMIIQSGVAPGDTVVTDGHLRLFPGIRIQPVDPKKIQDTKL